MERKNLLAIFNAKNDALLEEFDSITKGLIRSGDRFISDRNVLVELSKDLDWLKALEMEEAAVAQVASQGGIPWVIIRVISDKLIQMLLRISVIFLNYTKKILGTY